MTTSGTVSGEATQHPVSSPTSSSSPQGRSGSFGNEKESSRLKWTPELHQLFLDSVKILAASNDTVTPNNILRVMTERINTYDVPKFQLTRTHIASHLQKYRIDVRLHTLEASSAAGGAGGGIGGGQAVITNSPSPATSGNPRTHSVFKFTMMDPKKDAAAAAATTSSSSVPESPNPPSPSKLLSQSPPPPLAHLTAEDGSSEVDTNSDAFVMEFNATPTKRQKTSQTNGDPSNHHHSSPSSASPPPSSTSPAVLMSIEKMRGAIDEGGVVSVPSSSSSSSPGLETMGPAGAVLNMKSKSPATRKTKSTKK